MSEAAPRFSRWFQRWWIAVLGAVLVVGGAVFYETADRSIPRGSASYGSADSGDWAFVAPGHAFAMLQRLGEGMMLVGLAAVVVIVVVRVLRRG